MSANLLLSIVMIVVGVVFLILSFLFPDEITIGAFIASLAIAAFFYGLHKKQKNQIHSH
ncbi:hypothetical protein QOZ98_002272 [Planomicrobium stackebrandtii]|uniref:Uncharacterized protein n=1 Tax=Planomicrobium stackebrandtii TaxID=253160 RepID=A0ABU0GWY5_9BACL|nr:hypothetical protein [Planomicrobium stackebrandtii]MDQ0429444.1 hypothetical protein [Planomicrobium stackebrandtii]